jgi:predicted methyltransferase
MAHMVHRSGYKPGASLRGFKEYFPKGEIYGADFDKTILFQEDRIHTFYVDQTDPESIKDLWTQIDGEFDIMIDDALHTFEANKTFFLNSVHKLSKNGIYIIEDVSNADLPKWDEEIPKMHICYPDLKFSIVNMHFENSDVLHLIVIQRSD